MAEIGGDHRGKRQNKGDGGAGLDDADQAQPVSKSVDLKQKPFDIGWRDIVADHLVMEMADQVCQHRVSIAEIDHHQWNCRKQHFDDQNILPHNRPLKIHHSAQRGVVSHYGVTSLIAASPSMAYCTDSPARIMAVMREKTMVIFSFIQALSSTVRLRMAPVAAITASTVG